MMFKGHWLPVYLEFPIYASLISTQDILNLSVSDIINRIIWAGGFSKLFGTNSWHKAEIITLSGIMGIKSLPTSNHWKFLTTCKKNVSPFIPTCQFNSSFYTLCEQADLDIHFLTKFLKYLSAAKFSILKNCLQNRRNIYL